MPNCTEMSIPIENVYCLGHFYYTDIFSYRTMLSHSAFSKGTVTMDKTDTMHAHNYYDKSIISRIQEMSLVIKVASHSCFDNSRYFSVHLK